MSMNRLRHNRTFLALVTILAVALSVGLVNPKSASAGAGPYTCHYPTVVTNTGNIYYSPRLQMGDGTSSIPLGASRVVDAAVEGWEGVLAVTADGRVTTTAGDQALFHGDLAGRRLNAPVVGIGTSNIAPGYWLAAADGGVFSFGDVNYLGGMAGKHLNAPIVDIAVAPAGRGYWLLGADGGVFSFGEVRFYGSAANQPGAPFVAMAATQNGYTLARSNGEVVSFGEGLYVPPARGAATTIVDIYVADVFGHSVWLLADDGRVFYYFPGPGNPITEFLGPITNGKAVALGMKTSCGDGGVVGPPPTIPPGCTREGCG